MFSKKLDMDLLEFDLKKLALIIFYYKSILSNNSFYLRLLLTSGYKVKNQFKRINEPFSILIHPG